MLNLDKIKENIKEFKVNSYIVPLLLFLLGIFILLLLTTSTKKSETKQGDYKDTHEYVEMLEKTLKKNINKLNSVDDCSVMITIASVDDNEYLENKTISSATGDNDEEYSRQQEYLVIGNGGDDQVVLKSRHLPKISGALVVYNGSADIQTKMNILEAVSTVLSIQSNKVCVLSSQE